MSFKHNRMYCLKEVVVNNLAKNESKVPGSKYSWMYVSVLTQIIVCLFTRWGWRLLSSSAGFFMILHPNALDAHTSYICQL